MTAEDFALDEAMLFVSATIKGGIDIVEYLVRIDELASEVPSPTVEGIARHLFGGHNAFRGHGDNYYEPENSFLDQVIDRRLGIPVSLSVLMIEVGRRLGISLCGVGMPGHFLVGHPAEVGKAPEVFVDPFHGGSVLDSSDCRRVFDRLHANRLSFDEKFLMGIPPVAILDRALGNLKSIFRAHRQLTSLQWVMSLRTRLPVVGVSEKEEFLRLMAPFN